MKTKILRLLLTITIVASFIAAAVITTKLLSPEVVNYAVLGILLLVLCSIVYQLVKDTIYPDEPTSEPAMLDYDALLNIIDPIVEKPTEPKKRGRKPKTTTTTTATTKKRGK